MFLAILKNLGIIVLSTILKFLFGFAWHTMLFGKQWTKWKGIDFSDTELIKKVFPNLGQSRSLVKAYIGDFVFMVFFRAFAILVSFESSLLALVYVVYVLGHLGKSFTVYVWGSFPSFKCFLLDVPYHFVAYAIPLLVFRYL